MRAFSIKSLCLSVMAFSMIFMMRPAHAQHGGYYMTGQELYTLCTSNFNTDYGFCGGFITGVAEVMIHQNVGPYRSCNHGTVRSEQLISITKKFIEKNDDTMAQDGRTVVARALNRAFPCR